VLKTRINNEKLSLKRLDKKKLNATLLKKNLALGFSACMEDGLKPFPANASSN
jgi:hypothetical protein